MSALLRRVSPVPERYRQALRSNVEFLICPLVYYEVRRGLEKIRAQQQLIFFEQLATDFAWDDLQRDDWQLAATVWATLQTKGTPLGDTDILIGVYAARRGASVVTRNQRHFRLLTAYLPLTLDDWLSPLP